MIDGLKPYPAMEDSGVEWLGKMPAHWEVAALRFRYSQCLGKMLDTKRITGAHSLPYLRNVDVQWDQINTRDLPTMDIPTSEYDRYTVQEGDLLVCEGGEVGRCAIWSDELAVCGYQKALHRLRPRNLNQDAPRFLYYAFNAAVRTNAFDDGHQSTIAHLTGDKIRGHRFSFPPPSEQAAIVRFLDHADRRIRRYIRAKEKLIALLEEQKQAIIHRAVTGGIDVRTGQPYPAYKPSGVERLGDVPAHWEVRRLKSLVGRIDHGVSPQAENRLADSTSWGVLKAGCVNGGIFRETEHKRLTPKFVFDRRLTVRVGDVLVSRASGSPRLVGSVGRVSSLRQRLILSDKTFRLVFSQEAEPDFMVLAMNCCYYRQQVEEAISGAEGLANNLPLSSLMSFHFALPGHDEQNEIIKHLQEYTRPLSAGIARTARKIALIGELRTAMIADVVTGKLDVREAAAALPVVDPLAVNDEADDPFDAGAAPAFDEDREVAEVVG